MRPILPRPAPRGFSLVEVLVAMGVLAIGMVATFPLMTYATQRSTLARRESNAVSVGQDVLERLRNEIRYDSGGTGSYDLVMAGPTVSTNRWRADSLPHDLVGSASDLPTLPGSRRSPDCGHSTGANANALFMEREGEVYTVCYDFENPTASVCPGTGCRLDVNLKVMWYGQTGTVSERRLSGTLQGN